MSQKEAPRPGLIRAVLKGKLTNQEGAAALRLSVRHFRRLRAAYRSGGDGALVHGNRGKPSPRRLSEGDRQKVVSLMQGKYIDVNDTQLTEKLREVEGMAISRETVRRIRREAELPAKRRRRAPKHHRRREREGRAGALVLIDGSTHDWLEGRGPSFTLIGALDDATGQVLALVVREREDLHGYLELLGAVLRDHGVPLALYGDRFGALVRTDKHWTLDEELAGRQDPTQFGQRLEELGIRYIPANSPQAKGRVERLWNTLQDRLVVEMRLLGLTTMQQVREHLPALIADFNQRFARPSREAERAWRPAPRSLERVLTCRYRRTVARDNTVTLPGRWLQLPPRRQGRSWQGCKVEVREHIDGTMTVMHEDTVIARKAWDGPPFTLVYRTGGHARKRMPSNFRPVPRPVKASPQPKTGPLRRGQLTTIRRPAKTHAWKKSYKGAPIRTP